jgi:hypothetical protein
MIRATVTLEEGASGSRYGDYIFLALPAKGDTIVVHGPHRAEVVRVKHIEHFPAQFEPNLSLGDNAEHHVTIFVDWVEDID